ncbi:MAG: DUF4446 family protein [Patescibacteria group bacterium]
MDSIFDFISQYFVFIISIILATDILLIVFFFLINAKLRKIFKGEAMDIERVLLDLREHEKTSVEEMEVLKKRVGTIEHEIPRDIRKVGLVRYNPFSDAGGDQSFALALLDEHKNGVVISSLYGREMNRVYAKRIEEGECKKHQLTEEEKRAINEATAS